MQFDYYPEVITPNRVCPNCKKNELDWARYGVPPGCILVLDERPA